MSALPEPDADPMPAGAAGDDASAAHAGHSVSDPGADIADGIGHALDPRSITLERIVHIIGNGVIAGVLAGALALAPRLAPVPASRPILVAVWLLLAAALAWHAWAWPVLQYRHASYRVDPDEVEIRRGVLWRTVINVPRSRVQHTDVSQGPWERRLGLGTLAIYTAGTAHAKVALPGLAHERALLIREHLLPRGEHDVI